jgi:hypothetical protein
MVLDLLYIAAIVAFFALMVGFVHALNRLGSLDAASEPHGR